MSTPAHRELPKEQCIRELAEKFGEGKKHPLSILKLMRFQAELERALESHFAQWDMTRGRMMVLMLLYREKGSTLSPSDIADRLTVTRGNITGLIDGLENAGYLERVPHEVDRRAVTLALTASGKKFVEKVLPVHFRRMAKAMGKLTADDDELLSRVIDKLDAGLKYLKDPTLDA